MIYNDKIAANSKIRGSKGLYDCNEAIYTVKYLNLNYII